MTCPRQSRSPFAYPIGARVYADVYGHGTVEARSTNGAATIYRVRFDGFESTESIVEGLLVRSAMPALDPGEVPCDTSPEVA